jgi:hypothetical protein
MELKPKFFSSPAWLKPRRFSQPEAYLDLVGAYESGIVKGEGAVFFSLRWSWAPDEVERFIEAMSKAGWWNAKRERVGRPAIRHGITQGPPAAQREAVEALHRIYNEAFGRRLTLTKARRQAYARLLFAGLNKEEDPSRKFDQLCEVIQSKDFYMSDLKLHAPESLFRNTERCESWLEEASGHKPLSVSHAQERKKLAGFIKPVPTETPPLADVDALYAAMSDEQQTILQTEFNERKKRLTGLTRFRDTMEQAVWSEIVLRAAR